MPHLQVLLLVAIAALRICLGGFNLCDDRDVPPHAAVTESPWFRKCNYKCNNGFTKVRKLCCKSKPEHSSWTNRACEYICVRGFTKRGNVCCKEKPDHAIWMHYASSNDLCLWTCPRSFVLDSGACVDEVVLEVLQESVQESERRRVDSAIDGLVDEQLREHFDWSLRQELRKRNDHMSADDLMDELVARELERRSAEAQAMAESIEADLDRVGDRVLSNATAIDSGGEFMETDVPAIPDFDAEVDFLRATIRFQNARLKQRKERLAAQGGSAAAVEQLERDLETARSEAAAFKKRSEGFSKKLDKYQSELGNRRKKVLSVSGEVVHVQHESGDWKRIYYAILDTGNSNVCTLSKRIAKDLGMSNSIAKSRRTVRIEGVIPGKIENWPLISISLRIKGRVFSVDAAVGGDTPLLVSHSDVISRLMAEDGFVIGADTH